MWLKFFASNNPVLTALPHAAYLICRAMKTRFSHPLLVIAIALLSACSFLAHAQKSAPPKVGCMDAQIRLQADEIKQHFLAQGMEVFRDAMIGMESQIPYPVMINLQRGQLYQIIYVAHPQATRMFLDIYDGQDRKMKEIMQSFGRGQPTYISFSFVPETSDMYMFVARQKWKDNDMCGSFTILKPKAGASSIQLRQYTP